MSAWNTHIVAWNRHLASAGRPKSTRELRIYHVRKFAKDHADTQLRIVSAEQVTEWFAAHDWAPQTRRGYRASLKQFFDWAVSTGRRKDNPTLGLPAVKLPRTRPRPAPDDVVRQGMFGQIDSRVPLMVWLLASTGLRRAELAALHSDNLEGSLDGPQLRVRGKGGHERIIPVSDELADVLAQRTGYIFPGQIDGHLSPAYVGKLVSRALGDGWTAHTLRHRFASQTYRVDRDLRAVQELLGHASVATTQIYTAVPTDSLRRAVTGAAVPISNDRFAA